MDGWGQSVRHSFTNGLPAGTSPCFTFSYPFEIMQFSMAEFLAPSAIRLEAKKEPPFHPPTAPLCASP
jgi:hypothetical protein